MKNVIYALRFVIVKQKLYLINIIMAKKKGKGKGKDKGC